MFTGPVHAWSFFEISSPITVTEILRKFEWLIKDVRNLAWACVVYRISTHTALNHFIPSNKPLFDGGLALAVHENYPLYTSMGKWHAFDCTDSIEAQNIMSGVDFYVY